jgi:hypothetical protein
MTRPRILALTAGVCLAFAASARAGDFSPPIDTDACGTLAVAGGAMPAPMTAFIFAETPELCAKLCERARKLCRICVNDSSACYLRLLANTRTFGKLNCESAYELPSEQRMCKENTIESVASSIAIVRQQRQLALADCDAWRDDCRDSCLAP